MGTVEKCSWWSVLSAMFLVGGTCIGGGMLALPVITGPAGFIPSLIVMVICWAAMTASALLLLEVSLWMKEGAHVITMSGTILGRGGKSLAWVLYLFICYASIVAYTAGGGTQVAAAVETLVGMTISKEMSCTLFLIVFGAAIYLGSAIVGRLNAVLFIAMIVAYVALIGIGHQHVRGDLLLRSRWTPVWLAVPFLLTSFSFQTLVPSLTPILKRNAKQLRLTIIGGTTIALVIYLVWQCFVLGIIPLDGQNGLLVALQKGEPATGYLKHEVGVGALSLIAEYFAFFALVTSFLGMALGLFDFLSDGLGIPKVGSGRVILTLLIGIPTLLCAVYFERAFIVAMDASGGYGDSILNGILPVLMVWVGRYRLGLGGPIRMPGGKVVLGIIFALFASALLLEIAIHAGWAESYLGIHVPEDMYYYKVESEAEAFIHGTSAQ